MSLQVACFRAWHCPLRRNGCSCRVRCSGLVGMLQPCLSAALPPYERISNFSYLVCRFFQKTLKLEFQELIFFVSLCMYIHAAGVSMLATLPSEACAAKSDSHHSDSNTFSMCLLLVACKLSILLALISEYPTVQKCWPPCPDQPHPRKQGASSVQTAQSKGCILYKLVRLKPPRPCLSTRL